MLWIVAALVAQAALPQASELFYRLVSAWLDRRHPDNLPLSGGRWATEQVARLGLQVPVLVGPCDFYAPDSRTIALNKETYRKADPSCWATAAHEIGHALLHARFPRLDTFMQACRLLGAHLWSACLLVVVANLWVGLPLLALLARALVLVAFGLQLVQLAGEIQASITALRLLRREAAFDRSRRMAAVLSLGAAFTTYLSSTVAQLLIYAALGRVPIASPPVAAAAASWRIALFVCLALVLLWTAFARLVNLFAKPPMAWMTVLQLPALLLAVLTAKLSVAPLFVVELFLALIAARSLAGWVLLPASVGPALLFTLLKRLLGRALRGEHLDWRSRLIETQPLEMQLRERMNGEPRPRWQLAIVASLDLLYLPLLIALPFVLGSA
jgi:Zn-dependent membrane protease YugP